MFNLQNQKKITNLNVNAHIYNHEKFGCQHLHLESENNEKFLWLHLELFQKIQQE